MSVDMKRYAHKIALVAALWFVLGVGAFAGYMTGDIMGSHERTILYSQFPRVRAEERESCKREFAARIDGMQKLLDQQSADAQQIKELASSTKEIAAYTLRFLGDRARVADAHQAELINQAKAAASAASQAVQANKALERTVNDAAAKAALAASAAQSADKRLDTAVQPAQPAKPWAGGRPGVAQ